MIDVLSYAFALLPVLVFLFLLTILDSYRLVGMKQVLLNIAFGIGTAILCLVINLFILNISNLPSRNFSLYLAPIIEETIKSLYITYLVISRRAGFMVDIAIYGFAIGAGFALFENMYYLLSLGQPELGVWLIRGFGTAAIHGTATAIFGIMAKNIYDRINHFAWYHFVLALIPSIIIHSAFNHLIGYPVFTTLAVVLGMPLLMLMIFDKSDKSLYQWLGEGMDTDIELLEIVTTAKISKSRVGKYLDNIRDKYSPEMIADTIGYLRIHCELALRAKGMLLAAKSGIKIEYDEEIQARLNELAFLKKSLGMTGLLALRPLLRMSNRELWQFYHIRK